MSVSVEKRINREASVPFWPTILHAPSMNTEGTKMDSLNSNQVDRGGGVFCETVGGVGEAQLSLT